MAAITSLGWNGRRLGMAPARMGGDLNLFSGQPERQGFGLELLTRTLPYDLRDPTGVEFRREGLRFSMALPLGPEVLAG
ncbi:MAG: hypothetical protein M3N39_09750 [Pseudomonadota bacterium]|nr:hypothetical protein [Pseudomonadota bacterium]